MRCPNDHLAKCGVVVGTYLAEEVVNEQGNPFDREATAELGQQRRGLAAAAIAAALAVVAAAALATSALGPGREAHLVVAVVVLLAGLLAVLRVGRLLGHVRQHRRRAAPPAADDEAAAVGRERDGGDGAPLGRALHPAVERHVQRVRAAAQQRLREQRARLPWNGSKISAHP